MEPPPPDRPSRGVLTVPNAISTARLLVVPYFWYLLVVREDVRPAAVLLIVIGSTDWVDGYLARRLGQVSALGKVLDPVADRLMVVAAVLGGLVVGVVPLVLGIPLLVREAVVGGGVLYGAARGAGRMDVRTLGKVATFLLYGAVPAFYLTEAETVPWLFGPLAWISGIVGLVLYYWVGVQYAGDLRAKLVAR